MYLILGRWTSTKKMLYDVCVGFLYSRKIIEMGLGGCIWVGFCCCHFEDRHKKTTRKKDICHLGLWEGFQI